jgi:serine O-acetyltransferase
MKGRSESMDPRDADHKTGGEPCALPGESGSDDILPSIVQKLCQTNNRMVQKLCGGREERALPSRATTIEIVEELRSVLFPGYFGVSEVDLCNIGFHVGSTLDRVRKLLKDQVSRGLCFVCPGGEEILCQECRDKSVTITHRFISRLPDIQRLLSSDVSATYAGDPAATSADETIFCYPGILALTNFRIAHELHLLGVPLIPRMITEHAHSIAGVDIHPGARIGESLFIDHGTGVVIGETTIIGNRVKIYQGVTLGAVAFPADKSGVAIKGRPRHPIVEDDVIIYSGATILGRITIGKGSVIGGNVWLTESVPPGSRVLQSGVRPERFRSGEGI